MNQHLPPPGRTTIALDVLEAIARLATIGVPGVSELSAGPGSVDRLFKKDVYEGVRIVVENNTVYADLYVVLKGGMSVRDICHSIQQQVARAISEMVGMEVGKVNVHVEDIDYNIEPDS